MNRTYRHGRQRFNFDKNVPPKKGNMSTKDQPYPPFCGGVTITSFNTPHRLLMECDAADRRKSYTGQEQFIELPPGCKVDGEWTKGKKRYGTVDAVRKWLKENK